MDIIRIYIIKSYKKKCFSDCRDCKSESNQNVLHSKLKRENNHLKVITNDYSKYTMDPNISTKYYLCDLFS